MWDGQTIKWEKNEVKDNTLDLESKTQNQRWKVKEVYGK
jgi:hypothetical protein